MEIVQTPEQINRDIAARIAKEYGLAPMLRSTYEVIRSYMANDEYTAHPSINTIAKALQVCRNTAKSYISQLEDKGVLWSEVRVAQSPKGCKYNDTNIYTFVAEKFGETRKKVAKVVEVAETSYQKAKREMQEAVEALGKKYSVSECEAALKVAIRNIRAGITSVIKSPVKYLEAIIENKKGESEIAKGQLEVAESSLIKPSDAKVDDNKRKPSRAKQRSPRTSFHNFEQRSYNYDNDELERMIREKNGANRKPCDESVLERIKLL